MLELKLCGLFILACMGIMALAARAHGHGNEKTDPNPWPKWARIAGKAVFGIAYGLVAAMAVYTLTGLPLVTTTVFFGWAWIAVTGLSTGHGTVYQMGGRLVNPVLLPEKPIELVIRPIFTYFGWSIYQPGYSWACMAFKGLWIGGIPLCIFWPVAYWWGMRVERRPQAAEWASGALAGLDVGVKIILLSGIASVARIV